MARLGPSIGQAVGRGLTGRCPMCGQRGIFVPSRLDLREDCPNCGLHFERESGFWLGSMVVIMALVLTVFAIVTVGGIALFWPDVPWTAVWIAGIVANIAVPMLCYGWTKSVWQGLAWGFSPPDVAEAADIMARRAALEHEAGDQDADSDPRDADAT